MKLEGERLGKEVMLKLEEGNYKGAIRRLCSEDTIAPMSLETLEALKNKNPAAPPNKRPSKPPDPSGTVLHTDTTQVRAAVFSFPQGSSGGLDGLTPQHLKDLIRI